jgi:hypothetical protein
MDRKKTWQWLIALSSPLRDKAERVERRKAKERKNWPLGNESGVQARGGGASAARRTRAPGRRGKAARPVGVGEDGLRRRRRRRFSAAPERSGTPGPWLGRRGRSKTHTVGIAHTPEWRNLPIYTIPIYYTIIRSHLPRCH